MRLTPHELRVSRAYHYGAPGPAVEDLQDHAFLHSQQHVLGTFTAAAGDWEHGEKEEQPQLQPGYQGKRSSK